MQVIQKVVRKKNLDFVGGKLLKGNEKIGNCSSSVD